MAVLTAVPAFAAQCGGDFNAFLSAFSREAQAQKISPQLAAAGLGAVEIATTFFSGRRPHNFLRHHFAGCGCDRLRVRAFETLESKCVFGESFPCSCHVKKYAALFSGAGSFA